MTLRLIFSFVIGLALGVLIRDLAQDYRDQEQAKKLSSEIRSCSGYWVTKSDLSQSCRALQPRADWMYPVEAKPLRKEMYGKR